MKASSQIPENCFASPELQEPFFPGRLLLGDFNAKVGRKYIFKPAVRNDSLHEISGDNGIRLIFPVSTNLFIRISMFPYRNIVNTRFS
jgi:hypothetical protein